jgi:myo-inositol-1(or 4)-monophosphatase
VQQQEQPSEVLARIEAALEAAAQALKPFTPGRIADVKMKGLNDPVTEADHAVNTALQTSLLRRGEGWLSEESKDDLTRLNVNGLWVVDPIDGTREFISGIPEWGVSVGWVEDGLVRAGGILSPQAGLRATGGAGLGALINGRPTRVSDHPLAAARVLASRSEMGRGEWKRFDAGPFSYAPVGSMVMKLALVASGQADATFTLQPKNEWDVAGGMALVEGAGGIVVDLDGKPLTFNNRNTLYPGLIAGSPRIVEELLGLLGRR